MSIEVKPGFSAPIEVNSSYSNEIDFKKITELIKNFIPKVRTIVVSNKTKTVHVRIHFVDATMYVEVTNEEEDSRFKFQETPNQTPENPKPNIEGTE